MLSREIFWYEQVGIFLVFPIIADLICFSQKFSGLSWQII
ncbi:hypothetical protein SynROS8604_00238 [Synechococcus sp. ROS8604]|nr:hypothetical protein SynROS8604_00238 [Synechococcus sp. ROS8604]